MEDENLWVFTDNGLLMKVELAVDGLSLNELIEYFPTANYFYAELIPVEPKDYKDAE